MAYCFRINQTVTKVEYTEGGEKASIYTYNYDKNGNQTGMLIDGVATVTYQYDNLNRLTKTTKDGKEYKNLYNAEGLRVGKTDEVGKTVYLYEGNKVVMELDADGNMLAKNVYGTNLVKRMIEDGTTLYYMYNGHADVTALLDTEGNLVGSYYYDAWGNLLESSGEMKDKNSILYAGYQYDSETELYYLNARMYDPKVARFLQEDTYLGDAGDPLSLNLYTYCVNNPVIYWDPTGHYAANRSDEYLLDYYIEDYKLIADYSKQWLNAKSDKERESIAKSANEIRNKIAKQDKEYAKYRKEGGYKSQYFSKYFSQSIRDLEEYMIDEYSGEANITIIARGSFRDGGMGHVFIRLESYEKDETGKTKRKVDYRGLYPADGNPFGLLFGGKGVLADDSNYTKDWDAAKVYKISNEQALNIKEKTFKEYENKKWGALNINCVDFAVDALNDAGIKNTYSKNWCASPNNTLYEITRPGNGKYLFYYGRGQIKEQESTPTI